MTIMRQSHVWMLKLTSASSQGGGKQLEFGGPSPQPGGKKANGGRVQHVESLGTWLAPGKTETEARKPSMKLSGEPLHFGIAPFNGGCKVQHNWKSASFNPFLLSQRHEEEEDIQGTSPGST